MSLLDNAKIMITLNIYFRFRLKIKCLCFYESSTPRKYLLAFLFALDNLSPFATRQIFSLRLRRVRNTAPDNIPREEGVCFPPIRSESEELCRFVNQDFAVDRCRGCHVQFRTKTPPKAFDERRSQSLLRHSFST